MDHGGGAMQDIHTRAPKRKRSRVRPVRSLTGAVLDPLVSTLWASSLQLDVKSLVASPGGLMESSPLERFGIITKTKHHGRKKINFNVVELWRQCICVHVHACIFEVYKQDESCPSVMLHIRGPFGTLLVHFEFYSYCITAIHENGCN